MSSNPSANAGGNKGMFIVIEGTDGSGKGTQFNILKKRLEKEGYEVETFDFPQYDKDSSFFVKEYLNGKYGSAEDVGPFTGSLFYALDRYQASFKIKQALKTSFNCELAASYSNKSFKSLCLNKYSFHFFIFIYLGSI